MLIIYKVYQSRSWTSPQRWRSACCWQETALYRAPPPMGTARGPTAAWPSRWRPIFQLYFNFLGRFALSWTITALQNSNPVCVHLYDSGNSSFPDMLVIITSSSSRRRYTEVRVLPRYCREVGGPQGQRRAKGARREYEGVPLPLGGVWGGFPRGKLEFADANCSIWRYLASLLSSLAYCIKQAPFWFS